MNNAPEEDTIPVTSQASAMLFGTIIFTAVACTVTVVVSGDWGSLRALHNPRSSAFDTHSFASVYTLLYHSSIFGVILLYAYICENHPPFPHGVKTYDRDEFFFLTALLILVSLFTWKRNDPKENVSKEAQPSPPGVVAPSNDATEILNRDQTEEWKGWMQFMFLLYHYHHAEEVYNSIRVMITCYVFMTGYGNLSFFYIKGDYGVVRVLQMLWRLNFLVTFLCLTQGTTYILYYICLLHTYFFLMVYATMRVAKEVNYTKWGLRIKMGILAAIIFIIWDVDSGLFRLLHMPFLREKPVLGATNGSMWEWYFRSTLDHWSTYLGMVFESYPVVPHFLTKFLIGSAMLAATYLWASGPFLRQKFDYNQTNAYFACIPVFCYIYFRNLTPWLRRHSLDLLHQIGKTTLETYLMQHHIWLTSDAKSLLILIPGWPKMNFLVVSVVYVVLSRRLYQLTLFLRGMLLPNDKVACIRNTVVLAAAIAAFLIIAFVSSLIGFQGLWSILIVSSSVGSMLFTWILDSTWSRSRPATTKSHVARSRLPEALGLLILCLLGTGWNYMAVAGSSKIRPLTSNCAAQINSGSWVPTGCAEENMGAGYRQYGTNSYGTCSPSSQAYVWGWNAAPSSASRCRPVQRDTRTLTKALSYRNITFVGDSIVRHLYHAMCRQVGDTSAGAYNTTLGKWSDYSRHYGNGDLEFRWAPYVDEMGAKLNEIQNGPSPDIVIVGGGPWDKLHRYNSNVEKSEVDAAVAVLKDQMEALRAADISVVWVVPTTMNSWGLNTPEKRESITEDQMAWFRKHFESLGINAAASFVLNGPSFTAERVDESYDGVHYPLSVYDAGAQILANSFDWLLPERDYEDAFKPPRPGKMAHPLLGVCMVIFVVMGLFLFDGLLGLSYVAAFVVPELMPSRLYKEAFGTLHQNKGLPLPTSLQIEAKSKDSDLGDGSERTGDELEAFTGVPDGPADTVPII